MCRWYIFFVPRRPNLLGMRFHAHKGLKAVNDGILSSPHFLGCETSYWVIALLLDKHKSCVFIIRLFASLYVILCLKPVSFHRPEARFASQRPCVKRFHVLMLSLQQLKIILRMLHGDGVIWVAFKLVFCIQWYFVRCHRTLKASAH